MLYLPFTTVWRCDCGMTLLKTFVFFDFLQLLRSISGCSLFLILNLHKIFFKIYYIFILHLFLKNHM